MVTARTRQGKLERFNRVREPSPAITAHLADRVELTHPFSVHRRLNSCFPWPGYGWKCSQQTRTRKRYTTGFLGCERESSESSQVVSATFFFPSLEPQSEVGPSARFLTSSKPFFPTSRLILWAAKACTRENRLSISSSTLPAVSGKERGVRFSLPRTVSN